MKTPLVVRCSAHMLLTLLLACTLVKAEDLQVLKLNGRWSQTPTNYFLANANSRQTLAVSDKWIIASTPYAAEQATDQGAVQVFNAVTGAWVRKLLPPPPAVANTRFGSICVIAGNNAVISTDPSVGLNQVFVYDLLTGKKLRELMAPGLVSSDFFGCSIAVAGDRVLVGAHSKDGRGAAYLFSLRTGALVAQLQPASTLANDYFGLKIAIDGSLAVISAPGDSSNTGCAYLYDLGSQTLISKLTPASAVAGDNAGEQGIALTEGKVVLTSTISGVGKLFFIDTVTGDQRELSASDGVSGDDLGISLAADSGLAVAGTTEEKVYVFDLRSSSNTEIKILPPGIFPTDGFSLGGVAIYQGTVLSSAGADNTLADGCGAVYTFRTLTRPLPMTKVAARGDFAPGTAETMYATLGDAFINADSEVAFTSTLTGGGSNAGKDNGMWSTMAAFGYLDLVLKSRDTVVSSNVVSVSRPLINRPSTALYRVTRSGTGITAQNNQLLMKENGATTSILFQNPFGTTDQSYTQLVQSSFDDLAAYTLTLRKGINGVNVSNDSGMVIINPLTSAIQTEREGDQIGATGKIYGQFTGRVALYNNTAFYTTALLEAPPFNQAIVRKVSGSPEVVIAEKGFSAPDTSETFSAFLGESTDDLGNAIYRATMRAPVASNEGLWARYSGGANALVLRKGTPVPMPNAPKIARFINFWVSNGQTLALVTLSGSGVTAANDQALLLYQNTPGLIGTILVLMREGDPAPGCHPATIGTISRVEVETFHGQYLVLATLAGAPAGTNQCLFRGATKKDAPTAGMQYLRRPAAILRKGERFTGRTSKLKSISLPTTNLTAAGAGSTGLGSAMQHTNGGVIPNNIVLTLQFDNGVRQIMKGIP